MALRESLQYQQLKCLESEKKMAIDSPGSDFDENLQEYAALSMEDDANEYRGRGETKNAEKATRNAQRIREGKPIEQ
jgi:hypothetical protein